jgi:molecular chaperone HscB
MSLNRIPVRAESTLECRNCGAGAPVDEHFCPQCSRILAIGRHGDYFTFFGIERRLQLDATELERRFRELSRKFHPDFYYNAEPAERLASLERSSYLNDAYRVLRSLPSRVEYLLSLEGLPPVTAHTAADSGQATNAAVPPALLEEVFELNEELDEIREQREAGAEPTSLASRLDAARAPIERKREEHEQQIEALSARWDGLPESATPAERRAALEALRETLLERNYINNLLATIEREGASVAQSQEPKAERHG